MKYLTTWFKNLKLAGNIENRERIMKYHSNIGYLHNLLLVRNSRLKLTTQSYKDVKSL